MQLNFTDQLKRRIILDGIPQKIISVVPSQTELLYDLGLDEAVIGITKFCVHPTKLFRNKTRVGGTKNLNISLIKSLNPDLILANKEENSFEQIEELSNLFPTWVSDVNSYDEALEMIDSVGELTGKHQEAKSLNESIKSEFKKINSSNFSIKVAYLIWNEPIMLAGSGTFIHDMIKKCNFTNCFEYDSRYPEVDLETLKEQNPQVIMLSSEPFPFNNEHLLRYRKSFPQSIVIKVDGELFSWYGSRMKDAPNYFNSIINQISNAHTTIS